MRHLIGVLLGVVCFSQSLLAQKLQDNNWKFGQISLQNGQRLRGELKFDLKNDIVVFHSGEQLQAYSTYSVKSFTAVDSLSNFPQRFYSLPYAESGVRSRQMFFQLVFKGSFALFVREKKVPLEAAQAANLPTRRHPQEKDAAFVHTYYVYLPDGSLREFKAGIRHIAELFSMGGENKLINQYIADTDFEPDSQPDIIRLIDHFVDYKTLASR